jgi:hypothetical protein
MYSKCFLIANNGNNNNNNNNNNKWWFATVIAHSGGPHCIINVVCGTMIH